MDKLKHQLLQLIKFSEDELREIIDKFYMIPLRKKENFITAGDICRQIAYLVEGSLIYIRTDAEGNQVAVDFAFEGEWVTYLRSFLLEETADVHIVANEHTILNAISKENLYELYETHPKMERLGRILLERGLVKMIKGYTTFQTMDNLDRYLYLMENNPKVLERIPQYHIATYLGIKPESLSRIRRKLTK